MGTGQELQRVRGLDASSVPCCSMRRQMLVTAWWQVEDWQGMLDNIPCF